MSWTIYGILVIFGLFIILMIINPSLSCFGRRIRSPFYPVTRKKKKMRVTTTDYRFDLGSTGASGHKPSGEDGKKKPETEDYGFKLD
ncbi:MAG: hypothetical protein WBI18_02775 [Candidatus Saccharicenans sp.]